MKELLNTTTSIENNTDIPASAILTTCLLIHGDNPLTLNFELILRKRFTDINIKRIFSTAGLQKVAQGRYDLLFIASTELVDEGTEWLTSYLQRQPQPLAIALVENEVQAQQVLDLGFAACVPVNCDNDEFAYRLDQCLELHYQLQHHSVPLAGYQALEVIHSSEASLLYRVSDKATQQELVIKRYKLDSVDLPTSAFSHFLQSAQQLRQIHHPNLVQVQDAGASMQGVWLMMDYIQGLSLKEALEFGLLPSISGRIAWVRSLASALQAMHQEGIVHGDLKASNIMLNSTDEPVLLDFGLEYGLMQQAGLLGDDEIYATPYYVNPERVMRESGNDEQADIYALGVLLYELLAERKPYEGGELEDVLAQHVLSPIPTLPKKLKHYQSVIDALMAKMPYDRPQSMAEVLALL